MEQKIHPVKKILKISFECLTGFMLFIPFLLVVQNSMALHQMLLSAREQIPFGIGERGEIMGYIIFCLSFPYLCWLAGRILWRTKNTAAGFGKALAVHLISITLLVIIFILGPAGF
jgi:hypothetical protein